MKRIIFITFSLLTAFASQAADYPKAQIKAVYTYKYLIRHTAGHDIENTDNAPKKVNRTPYDFEETNYPH